MKSPYHSIIKYGAEPIDSSTRKVIGQRVWNTTASSDYVPIREIEKEFGKIEPFRRHICPYCGKAKMGMADHIKSKHPGKAVVLGKPEPLSDPGESSRTTGGDSGFTKPSSSVATAVGTGNFACFRETGSVCALCGKAVRRLAAHLRISHKTRLFECPCCFELLASTKSRVRCPSCGKAFKLSASGKPVGFRGEWPFCFNDSYLERIGTVTCTFCKHRLVVTKSRNISKLFLRRERLLHLEPTTSAP